VLHCKQTSVEEEATTALLKEQTRFKTMGFPRKVSIKGFNRPISSTAALGTVSASASSGLDAVHGAGMQSACSTGGAGVSGRGSICGSQACVRKPVTVKASDMVDTQKSSVPLKWAASNLVPPCSMYTSAHGAHPGRSPQVCNQALGTATINHRHHLRGAVCNHASLYS
jgi:hypothetical protein